MNVNKESFTLIELLIVVLILSLIFSISLSNIKLNLNKDEIINFKKNIKRIYKPFYYFCKNDNENKIHCYFYIDNNIMEDKNKPFEELPILFKKNNNSLVENDNFIMFFENSNFSNKYVFKYKNNFYLMSEAKDELIKNDDFKYIEKMFFNNNIDISKNDIGEFNIIK